MRKTLLMTAAACILGFPAAAQTFDYGEYEKIFDEPVTTGATGKPQRVSEAPVTMDIITAEDIQRSGATTIPELLSRLSRIDVLTWSQGSADVAIGGLDQGAYNRMQVLVNGRENYQDTLGSLAWQQIPISLDEIRQIEVVKGPNSALYGFNAAAGVINIITYNPQYDDVRAERVTVGTNGDYVGSVVRSIPWEGGGVRLSASYTASNDRGFHPAFQADREASANSAENQTYSADAQTQINDHTQLRLQLAATAGTLRLMYVLPVYLAVTTYDEQLDLTSDTAFGQIDLNVTNNTNIADPLRATIVEGSVHNDISIVKLSDLFKVGAADSFRLATEFRLDRVNALPTDIAHVQSQDYAFGGMWDHAFSEQVDMTNAIRLDHLSLGRSGTFMDETPFTNRSYNDRTITATSFNSAVVYRPTDVDSFKAMISRGLTLPSLTEFGAADQYAQPFPISSPPVQGRVIIFGNPDLNVTRNDHYEASYERGLPSFNSTVRVAAYHEDVRDIRDLTINSGVTFFPVLTLTGTFWNVGDANLNGFDLDFKGKADAWRWSLNYSYENVRDSVPTLFHVYSKSSPRNKANASIGYDAGRWQFDTYVRYVSSTDMLQQYALTQYQLYHVKDLTSVSQRVSYEITPKLHAQATITSGYADNPVWSEGTSAYFSIVATY